MLVLVLFDVMILPSSAMEVDQGLGAEISMIMSLVCQVCGTVGLNFEGFWSRCTDCTQNICVACAAQMVYHVRCMDCSLIAFKKEAEASTNVEGSEAAEVPDEFEFVEDTGIEKFSEPEETGPADGPDLVAAEDEADWGLSDNENIDGAVTPDGKEHRVRR